MTVNRLSGNRVLIILEQDEMRDLALDLDNVGSGSRSLTALSTLSRTACRREGIDEEGRRLKVEAMSLGESCYLLVTVRRHPQRYRLKRGEVVCCRLANCTDFLNAVEMLYRLRWYGTGNAAYEWNGSYYLLFDFHLPL